MSYVLIDRARRRVVEVAETTFPVHDGDGATTGLAWRDVGAAAVIAGQATDDAFNILPPDPPDPVDKIAAVKAEARRRILAFLPVWKQANLTARAVELIAMGAATWTAAEAAEWDAGSALWNRVKALRRASDVIEARRDLATIDVTDDRYWLE